MLEIAVALGLDLATGYYTEAMRAEYEKRGVHFCKATYSKDRAALGLRVVRFNPVVVPRSPLAVELQARMAEFSARLIARREAERLARHPTPCRITQRRAANNYLNSGINLRQRGAQAALAKRFGHSPAMVCKIVNKILCDIERGTIKIPRGHAMRKNTRAARTIKNKSRNRAEFP